MIKTVAEGLEIYKRLLGEYLKCKARMKCPGRDVYLARRSKGIQLAGVTLDLTPKEVEEITKQVAAELGL